MNLRNILPPALLASLLVPATMLSAATVTWTGTGSTAWSNAANWGGTPLDANPTSNAVTFNTANVPNQATNNDLSNLILSSLTFGTTLNQATSLGGNAFTLAGGLTASTTGQNVSIGNNVTLGAASTWNIARNVTLSGTLGDDGTARVLTKSGNGLLALGGGAYVGNGGGNILVTGGALGISNANQLSDAWLNLNGGVVVLDGVSWSQFSADRSSGWHGTGGANAWGINANGGGLAARGTDVNVFINASTAASYGTITAGTVFARNFTLGSSARDMDGSLYANAAVNISQDTVWSDADRTIQVSGGLALSAGVYSGIGTSSPINDFSGLISGMGPTRRLIIQSVSHGAVANGSQGGVLRLSNANTFEGTLNVGSTDPSSGNGYGVLIGTTDAAFGNAANVVRIASSTPGGSPNTGWAVLLGDASVVGANEFSRDFLFDMRGGPSTGRGGALGSFAGDVVFTGVNSIQDVVGQTTSAGTYNVGYHAESGSTFTLGKTGDAATIQTAFLSANNHVMQLEKIGPGTLVLDNVTYSPNGGNSFTWQIGRGSLDNTSGSPYFDGALRETGNTTANSLTGYNISLAGGVLETSNSAIGASFTRALGSGTSQVRWLQGGGGFSAHGGALTVDIGGSGAAQTWNATNFVTTNNALIFGSETANDVVTFVNPIILGTTGTNTREIRVVDNLDAGVTTDRAVLSGNLTQSGGTQSLLKSGTGILELTGANNYIGTTTVSGGTLRLNGATHAAGNNYTVSSGATLELLGAGLDLRAPQLVMNAGASLLQAGGGAWDVNDLFHIAGSGGSLEVADLADTNDGSAVLRYTVDIGGAGTLELTDASPFGQYGGSAAAWAAEWTIDLLTTPGLQQSEFVPTISLMSSTAYDLTGLNGLVNLNAWDSGSAPFIYTNLTDGQKVYVSSGVALAEYTVSFTENGFDLVFASSRAIPEPGTLSLIGLALLVLRRQLRKRAAA
jgi:fibronectin-binding autotransporter adhesin